MFPPSCLSFLETVISSQLLMSVGCLDISFSSNGDPGDVVVIVVVVVDAIVVAVVVIGLVHPDFGKFKPEFSRRLE